MKKCQIGLFALVCVWFILWYFRYKIDQKINFFEFATLNIKQSIRDRFFIFFLKKMYVETPYCSLGKRTCRNVHTHTYICICLTAWVICELCKKFSLKVAKHLPRVLNLFLIYTRYANIKRKTSTYTLLLIWTYIHNSYHFMNAYL